MELKELESALEGVLFASGEPVAVERLCLGLEVDRPTLDAVAHHLSIGECELKSIQRRRRAEAEGTVPNIALFKLGSRLKITVLHRKICRKSTGEVGSNAGKILRRCFIGRRGKLLKQEDRTDHDQKGQQYRNQLFGYKKTGQHLHHKTAS